MNRQQNCLLMFAVYLSVVIATRRRVPFMICKGMKSNSDLMRIRSARSRIECSKFCLDDTDCLSASYCKTPGGYTCQLSGLYAEGSCTGFILDVDCINTALVDPCENGGTFFPENRTCLCLGGFVGAYCHRHQRDCFEKTHEGETFYFIEPLKSNRIFRWLCVNDYTPITLIADTVVNLTYPYTWQQFKEGLVPLVWPTSNWIFCGLEYLHQSTSQGMYDMFILLVGNNLPNGKLWYRNFRVDSEANGYSMYWDHVHLDPGFASSYQYLDGFGGAGDATKNLNGSHFSTLDNDVSGCAHINNAGWWFNSVGCAAMKFEEAGFSWPTNRNGTLETELLKGAILGIQPVFWYTEDDLVL